MRNFIPVLLCFLTAPAFANVITVSVPACFVHEFEALEGAVAQIKKSADDLCSLTGSNSAKAVVQSTTVEQIASCNGFKISAVVECVSF